MSRFGEAVPRLVLAGLLIGASLAVTACRPRIDRARADGLAQAELAKYAEREHLTQSTFSTAEVTEHKGTWLYSYKYSGKPKHLLAIIVHKDGRTELSRMPEEEAAP